MRHILRHRRNAPSSDIDRARKRADERMSEECERECLFMSEWSGWSEERACCLSFLLRSLTGKRTNEAVKEELSTNVRSRRDQLSRRSSRRGKWYARTRGFSFLCGVANKGPELSVGHLFHFAEQDGGGSADEVGNVAPIRIWV